MQIKYQIERIGPWQLVLLAVYWHSIPRERTLGRLWGNLLTNLTTIPLAYSCVNVQNCSSFRENHRSYEKEAWKNIKACRDLSTGAALLTIGHFQVLPGLCFKPRERCSAFDMEIIFRSHASKTHFHKKGCAPSFILKVRVFGTRKWPIELASQLGAGSWSWLLK